MLYSKYPALHFIMGIGDVLKPRISTQKYKMNLKKERPFSSVSSCSKTAVVLFNLGGPTSLKAVKPFLFNLFYDRAIVNLPNPFRYGLAKFLSARREKEAQKIYNHLGGGSPLLFNTEQQAKALEKELGGAYKVFIAMRYWHPYACETFAQVLDYHPDQVVLLPLYPHFSTTTTASSFKEWEELCQKNRISLTTYPILSYPTNFGFLKAQADLLVKEIEKFSSLFPSYSYRVLFSAHGLPQSIVKKGDPYPTQIQHSVHALVSLLSQKYSYLSLEYRLCYQSRIGPLAWIGPSLDEEIEQCAKEKKGSIVVPISFVSEHSETLVELDIQYQEKAHSLGVPGFVRVPTVSTHPDFIKGLAELVKGACAEEGLP